MSHADLVARRRAELEGRLAMLTPEQRARLANGASGTGTRPSGIMPRAPGAPVPMSFAQELLWLLERSNPGHGYNVPRTARLRGPLDLAALRVALDAVVARHEVLRSTFDLVDDEPRQIVHAPTSSSIEVTDLCDMPAQAREDAAAELVRALSRRPFELSHDAQLRTTVIRLGDDDHVLLLESHHVSSDAWSRNILMGELAAFYEAARSGTTDDLPPMAVQYGDFAIWQRKALSGPPLERLLAYWREQLCDAPALLELPTDRPRSATPSFDGAVRSRLLPSPLLERVRDLSRAHGTTLFMTLLATFDVLLARLSGQEDILVGSPTAGRSHDGTEGLIGYFANTLVLRTRLGGDPTFVDVLARVREATLGAFEHQDVPYEKLVLELQRERALGRSGLFQVMFTLQDAELRGLQLPGLAFEPFGVSRGATKFDLSLFMHERTDGLSAAFEYRTDLFDASTIDRMLARLEVLLAGIVADPNVPISSLPILPPGERQILLDEWSHGAPRTLEAETLHEMIAQQVARTPDAVAVEMESSSGMLQRLTFGELQARAEELAAQLRAMGVGPDVGVGICIDRSPELVVAMLGVLRAGGYYLPLDPDYPSERIGFMLEDAQVPVLLTVQDRVPCLPPIVAGGPSVVILDRDWDPIARTAPGPSRPPAAPPLGDVLAYVIYTSGSTGRPKGVMIPHRAVVNYLTWMRAAFPLGIEDAVLQKAPASFDACIWEFFLPLVSGARLVLARPGAHQDPAYLLSALSKHDVTLLQLVPSQLQMMLETPGADAPDGLLRLRRLFLGGEALPSDLLTRLAAACPALRVTNLYGPTEATVYASHWSVRPSEWAGGVVPIGTPIDNAAIYLMSIPGAPAAPTELVPIGIAGELCIGGVGLARGYLGRRELTDEKFVRDPFAANGGARLYRTGDLARYRANGILEYLGRIDNQVKLRGFRVELGEIEAALVQQPGVQSAVVVVREDAPGDQRLVAYCIAVPGADAAGHTPAALRQALKATLPEYMVPTAFVFVREWPMSANGKLDRKALPAPVASEAPVAERVAPRTPTERTIAELWSDVLQHEVGVHDDFFELGGHSLLALRVLARVGERFRVRVPLRVIFEASTLETFAVRVDELARASADAGATRDAIPRAGGEAPLTHMQELFWLVERSSPALGVYNVAEQWQLDGALDVGALRHALDGVVARHDALRSSITGGEAGPVLIERPPRPVPLESIDLTGVTPANRDAALQRIARERSHAPFDFENDLLLRATLVRTASDAHTLVLVSHHIVYDGWSRGLLLRELSALYAQARGEIVLMPPVPPVRFADYAAWQRSRLEGSALEQELKWWMDRLADSPLSVDLPTDRPRALVPSFEGGKRIAVFPPELRDRLRQVAREADATMFMVLLAGFQTLLHRYTGHDGLVIGSAVAGRSRPEFESVVGSFVNTIPLRASFADDPTFLELVARNREEYLHASEHAELPFETLHAALQRERGAESTSFGQVHFVLQNNAPSGLRLSGVESRFVAVETSSTKFDLSLSMGEHPNGLDAAMQFRASLYDASTIERMLTHLHVLLDAAARAPRTPVSELPIMPPEERQRILVEWNDTAREYPRDATLQELVASHAARTPHAIAVSTATGETLTYAELDTRANQLAWALRDRGAGDGTVVGVCIEPSIDMIVALLAALKSGAAYLPLDPGYPVDRLKFMLEDTDIAVLVTSGDSSPLVADAGHSHVSLTADAEAIAASARHAPVTRATGADMANIVYTSGSTGRPKGSMLAHRGLVRLLVNTNYLELDASDVVAQMASPAFDALGLEVWGALLHGGRLAIVPRDIMLDPSALRDEIRRAGITTMFLTTAVFNQIARTAPDALLGVRNMLFGGEAADLDAARRVLEHSQPANLRNGYGPTEVSVFSCTYRVNGLAPNALSVPIGAPIGNTRVYVLDRRGHPVPTGVNGELYLAGDGVALGYLNRPELTAERFVSLPHLPESGARLYRTGDIVRWLPSGDIEFVGRVDNQVKIRGVRIELGEIESVVSADPRVSTALALVRDVAPGDARLLCYYVPVPGTKPDQARIHAALRRALPQSMMPSAIIELEAFPITPNGKVDRRALPLPSTRELGATRYQQPRTLIEHEMVQIWEKLLDRSPIGIRDDFFALGGHSLLAVRMLSEVGRYRGRHIPLAWLFESSTIESLVARIESDLHATTEPPLVVLQGETTGTPIAFVHGDGHGGGWYCRRLAPLAAPGSPFFVLPTLGADAEHPAWTIETMAERHVAELRKVQPHGPYRLIGFCVGGLIALEMAVQLREAGEAVDRLIIIDSAAHNVRLRYVKPLLALIPGDPATRQARQAAIMTRIRQYYFRIGYVFQLSREQQLEWTKKNVVRRWDRLKRLARNYFGDEGAVGAASGSGPARPSYRPAPGDPIMLLHERAGVLYIPRGFDGGIDLLYSGKRPNLRRPYPTRNFERVSAEVRAHPIPADHIEMITGALPELATVLREVLEPRSGD